MKRHVDLLLCLYHQEGIVDFLSPNQQAELLLDPESSALENEAIVRKVFESLTMPPDVEKLDEFFEAFSQNSVQVKALC